MKIKLLNLKNLTHLTEDLLTKSNGDDKTTQLHSTFNAKIVKNTKNSKI